MAGTNIGSGALVLTTDTSQLFKGLDQANKKTAASLDGMKKTATSKTAGIGAGMSGALKGMALGAAIGVGIGAGLAALELLKKGLEGAVQMIGDLAGKMTEASQTARKLGMSSEDVQGLQYASERTGESVEELAKRFKAGDKDVAAFVNEAKELGYVLGADKTKAFEQAMWAVSKVKTTVEGLVKTFLAKLAPVIELCADAAVDMLDKLGPAFDFVAEVIMGIADVAVPVFTMLFDLFSQAVKWLSDIVGGWLGVGENAMSVRDATVAVFRAIGVAGAYCWDVVKAGVGFVAIGVGYLIDGMGELIKIFADVVSLAKKLPDQLKPKGLDDFIKGVEESSAGVKKAGGEVKAWGQGVVDTFGESAKGVNKFFDGIMANQKKNVKELKKDMATLAQDNRISYKGVGAMTKGSDEALSVLARFETEKLLGAGKGMEKMQLDAINAVKNAVVAGTAKIAERLGFSIM